MNNRDIRLAHKRLQLAWEHLEQQWPLVHPDDPTPFLSQVWRSPQMQAAYYAQGRNALHVVNTLRHKAGLGPITAAENARKVTNAGVGRSKHERTPSEAFDIAFLKKGSKTALSWEVRLFLQAARLVRQYDPTITWGGDWNRNWKTTDERFIDYPHFQV